MKKIIPFILAVFMVLTGTSQVITNDMSPVFTELAKSKPDSTRVRIYIQLANYYFSRIRLINRLDSVEFYLKQARQLNETVQVARFQNQINILSAIHYSTKHPSEDPRLTFIPIIDTCKKTGDKSSEAQAWVELGLFIIQGKPLTPSKLDCYQNCLVLARELHDDYLEMKARRMIALFHFMERKIDLAESEQLEILKEEKKAGPVNTMYVCDMLAATYIAKGEYDKALQYALRTQDMLGISGDSANAGGFYGRLSEIYRYLSKPTESLEWARKNLDFKLATNNVAGFYRDVSLMSYLFLVQKKPEQALAFLKEQVGKRKPTTINDQRKIQEAFGDAYDELKMYDLAEKSYVEMIRLGNQLTDELSFADKGYANSNMGSFYFRRGNYKKALFFLEIALKNYESHGEAPFTRNSHLWLFKTDSALGDYIGSIRHLQASNRLGDSIFKIARNRQIEELQIKYETEKKDNNIRLLEGKEKLTQAQLQNAKNTRNWIIAGATMLLIIAGLLYRLASLRKKNNKIIKSKNDQLQHLLTEKEWLVKEIHHRVKNNLHTVIGLLNSQAAYLQGDALEANEISKHRIFAMSLIHQQLYNAEDIKTIDMSVYLPELLDYLKESFSTARNILFRHEIESLKLEAGQAIPVALIVNEAVTNSIKYAFPNNKEGIISVSLQRASDEVKLIIADDGIGIDPAILKAGSTSLGLKLMNGLSEDIDGKLNIINENGTKIIISFDPDSEKVSSEL